MIIFSIVFLIGIIGIGFVLWNMKNETQSQTMSVQQIEPDQLQSLNFKESFSSDAADFSPPTTSQKQSTKPPKKPRTSFILSLVSKIKIPSLKNKKNPHFDAVPEEPISLKDKLSSNPFNTPNVKPNEPFGTTPLKTEPIFSPKPQVKALSPEEVKKIESEIDLSTQFTELKGKYERLEKILNEKNAEFDKVQEALNHEQKNRKEFNKIKDLLEKELKDTKDQTREANAQMNLSKTEAEGHKKRIAQLEDKATKLEKEILKKEEEIDTLVKRLQTFASAPTASTPPKKEPIKEASAPAEPVTPTIETPAEIPSTEILNETPPAALNVTQTLNPEPAPIVEPIPLKITPINESPAAPSLAAELIPEPSKPIEVKDLNLQTKTPSSEEIKNIVDLLSVPQETPELSPEEPPEDLAEERPYLKLKPDIASEAPPKENPPT